MQELFPFEGPRNPLILKGKLNGVIPQFKSFIRDEDVYMSLSLNKFSFSKKTCAGV